MKLPDWVTDPNLNEDERARQVLSYRLRLAALHIDPEGSLKRLGMAAGYSDQYMSICIGRGKLPQRAELAVRQVVGSEVFPTQEELLAGSI